MVTGTSRRRARALLRYTALCLLVVSTGGCGPFKLDPDRMVHLQLYEGSARPRAEVAVLWLDGSSQIVLKSVDGDVEPALRERPSVTRFIQILPGRHTVVVGFVTELNGIGAKELVAKSLQNMTLDFEAKAGGFYTINGHLDLDAKSRMYEDHGIVPLPWSAKVEATGDPDPPIQQ